MRLLVISKNFMDERDAQAQQSFALAQALSNAGAKVQVIAGAIDSAPKRILINKRLHVDTLAAEWPKESSNFWGKFSRKVQKNLSACMSTRWAINAARHAQELMTYVQYNALISLALPMESHIAALKLSGNVPWIASLSDPWPESLLPKPYSDFSIPVMSFWQKAIVAKVFRSADALVFPCGEELKYLSSYYEMLRESKCHIIPHVAPISVPSPLEQAPDERRICIIHAGSISRERICQGLAMAIGELPESSRLHFKFLGNVHPGMKDLFDRFGASRRIEFVGWVSKSETLHFASSAQAMLVIEAEMSKYPFLPSKVADYSAIGKPLVAITGADSATARIIKEFDAGVVACHDHVSIRNALHEFEANPSGRSCTGLRGYFEPGKVAAEYIDLARSISGENNSG